MVMMGNSVEVCKKGRKGIADKSEAGNEMEYEVLVDGMRLEHESEFKYLGCVWRNQVHMKQRVVGRWRVGGGLQMLLGP